MSREDREGCKGTNVFFTFVFFTFFAQNYFSLTQIDAIMNLMSDLDEDIPKRNYKWPWFVLAAVLLFLALAIVWMGFAVQREKEERNFNAPIQAK